MNEVILVSNARSYHVMDWYRTVKEILKDRPVAIATDLICGEGYTKLVHEDDLVFPLLCLDRFLFNKQSRAGNIWRNILKLAVTPVQVFKLRQLHRRFPNAIFHAHSMYYIFLCYLAGLEYIATPMGSDVLLRPNESWWYAYFTKKSLKKAHWITVDSAELMKRIEQLCRKPSMVIQNGVEVDGIQEVLNEKKLVRDRVISIRAVDPLYRIDRILESRLRSPQSSSVAIEFLYPFCEAGYRAEQFARLLPVDRDLGRLPKAELYRLLGSTVMAVSIPASDSSPRTVYEAIFCGCAVAVSDGDWIRLLPPCMRSRLVVVDLNDESWFARALEASHSIVREPFVPSSEAMRLFDQKTAITLVSQKLYEAFSDHPAT